MIWNPWREIKRLREQVTLYSNMTLEECYRARYLESHVEYRDRRIKILEKSLVDIAAEEKPTSSGVVKRMAAMAREGLKQ